MARKKAIKKAPEVKMYGYKVDIISTNVHSEREDKPYGEWYDQIVNKLSTIATRATDVPDVVTTHLFEPGQNALVVWVEWNSGDSFGHGENLGSEVIGMFKDYVSAQSLADQIKDATRDSSGYSYTTPDGQVFTSSYAPWNGYFERLSGVHIDAVAVF